MAKPYDTPEAPEPSDEVKYWLNQIETAQKAREKWYKRAEAINKRYLDDAKELDVGTDVAKAHTMNVLWSNVETLKPALYAKSPNAKVSRRYRDKDPVGRWAAIVLERSLTFGIETYDFDYSMRSCVADYLLPGLGQVWISYEPDIEGDKISWEQCCNKHLHYKDFLHGPGRTWDEVPWVSQRAFMTKAEVEADKRFAAAAKDLSFEDADDEKKASQGSEKKAEIWEIWDKRTGKVIFVSKNCPNLLTEPQDPFLQLEGFFPCPRPILGTITTDNMIPTPDFYLYQNQADEIDRMTQRINLMTQALRVVGLYDATQQGLVNLLDKHKNTNEMVACDTWAVFSQNGGFKGSVEFLPLADVMKALQACYDARERAKQVMYEVTGISDIVRGASDPGETATAQQIKTQWGGLRIRDRQADVQRFARDVLRINAEIMSELFQPETLRAMTNVPLLDMAAKQQLQQRQQMLQQAQQLMQQDPAQAQAIAQQNPQIMQQLQPLTPDEEKALKEPAWEEVIQLLRDQKLRAYRIDIETDSTINTDETEEKAARTEFVTAMTTMATSWAPLLASAPKLAPLFGEMLTFATRAFPTAEGLETAIEEAVEMVSEGAMFAPQPAQPQEDPKIALEREKMDREDKHRMEERAIAQQNRAEDAQRNMQSEGTKERMQRYDWEQKRQSDREAQQAQAMQVQAAVPPKAKEIQAAVAPMFQQLGAALAQFAQVQSQIAVNQAQSMASLQTSIESMTKILAAPKAIEVVRDGQGRIQGGMSRSAVN